MLEVVPQRIYKDSSGIPAYKSGEWIGSRPNHFYGSKLILKPIIKQRDPNILGHNKHFPPQYSTEYQFKPSIHLSPAPNTLDSSINIRSGKRILHPIFTSEKSYPRNISNRPKDTINSYYIAPLFPSKGRRFSPINDHKECYIENLMTRKKRLYCLEDVRNKMVCNNPGDKNYKVVEHSPGFFLMEGLVVGSTNALRVKKTTKLGDDNFFKTLDLNIKVLDDKKIYDNKVKMEEKEFDEKYVGNLSEWEKNYLDDGEETKDKDKDKEKDKKKK